MLDRTITYSRPEEEKEYYDIEHLLRAVPDARYYVVYNGRQNGKTYSVLWKAILRTYLRKGRCGVYIRRKKETFEQGGGQKVFADLVRDDRIAEESSGEWDGIQYYGSRWYLTRQDTENDDKRIRDKQPCCYAYALNNVENVKSLAVSNVGVIVLDEFISKDYYLPDEWVLFCNLLSTLIRVKDDVKVFLLGNTINPYNPYFREMGLKHAGVGRQKKGTIDVYQYKDRTTGKLNKIACERPEESTAKSVSNVYFAFDSESASSRMITNGDWQIKNFPHAPCKWKPKDVKYTYFIIWEGEILQCEVVMTSSVDFTYIHRKTTPLKNPEKDIIFSQDYHAAANWARNILKPSGSVFRKIAWYYLSDKVFFQDNMVGQSVTNYLAWCTLANRV